MTRQCLRYAWLVIVSMLPAAASAQVVIAPGAGSDPVIRVLNPDGSASSVLVYDSIFKGGVRVALGDVDGDGVVDIITGAGATGGPHVKVFSGADLSLLASFFAYDPIFSGGIFVAAGDVNGDGRADIITGAGAGGAPHVKVFSGADLSVLASFFAYAPAHLGGVSVAAGDVNGDGRADIITGAGPGGGPHVRVFSGADLSDLASFYAYVPFFTGGVAVASLDFNGDGLADIVTGAGPGGGPHVRVFSGADLSGLASFYAYDPFFTGGVSVGAADFDGDGQPELVTGAGPGGGPHVMLFRVPNLAVIGSFYAFDPFFAGGIFIGSLPGGGEPLRFTSAPSTTFTAGSPATFTVTAVGTPTPTITVTGTLPAGVFFQDNGNGTGTLGTPLALAGTGGVYPLTFTATSSAGAATQAFTLTVQEGPSFTSPGSATFTVGTLGTFAVTTTTPAGSPTPTLSASLVPPGLTFTDNGDGTGTLAGIATGTGGISTAIITATNSAGTATQSLMLTLNAVPVVTSANTTTFTAGTAGSFAVTTTGFPLPTVTVSGALPSGVMFAGGSGSGALTGTPAANTSGSYPLTVTASNGVLPNATQAFTLTVNGPPAFTSANATTFTGAGTFSVTTSGLPAPTLSVSGTLPSGVSFVDNGNGSGTLSGPPAAGTSGSYPLTFSATNSIATVTQSFTLTVSLPATRLVVTQVNGGVSPSAGVGFAVVVQAWDSVGPAVVTASTAVSLSRQTGTGTLGGTLTGTLTAGSNSVTISGVTYTKAESGVSITAARTSGNTLTSGTSASFTVNPGVLVSYLLTPSSSSFLAGVASLVTVQPQDAFGNPRSGAAAVTITGRNASDTANNPNVQIDANRDGTYGDTVVNTAAGAATFNIANGVAESFTLRASDGAISGLSATITTTASSPVLISEFRFRGAGGIRDEYINLYNNTDLPITVSTTDGSAGWALVAADGVIRVTIPNGTVLPARGSYLITNNGASGFSLTAYPAGAGTVGSGDAQYTLDIPSSGVSAGIALFRSTTTFNLATRLDAVGYTTADSLYREGTGMNTGGAEQVVNLQQAYIRNLATGLPKDTDDNRADFTTVDTNGTLTGNGQRVGMPGPRGTTSPIRRAQILVSDIPATPSSVRDNRSTDWNIPGGGIVNWPSGVLSLPRRFTNNTGQAVTRLRVRIVSMTTFPENSTDWDLRPIDATGTVTDSTGTVIVSGLRPMLLELPQQQFNGGGINSTLTLDVSVLPGGSLVNGASVDVHLRIGVAQVGTTNPFILSFIVEALP